MIKTDVNGKTKIICDRCGYMMEFPTIMDALVYLSGRGRLYGWSKYCGYDEENILYCPMCADEFEFVENINYETRIEKEYRAIEDFERLYSVEHNEQREIIQIRLEMFQF